MGLSPVPVPLRIPTQAMIAMCDAFGETQEMFYRILTIENVYFKARFEKGD